MASVWLALLAVVYAALSPAFAAAALADRPAALARMLGLPPAAVIAEHEDHASGHGEHAGHATHESLPTTPDDDAAHYAHGIYCSLCLNASSTAALIAPPPGLQIATLVSIVWMSAPPQLAAAAAHPWFRSRAPPHFPPALS